MLHALRDALTISLTAGTVSAPAVDSLACVAVEDVAVISDSHKRALRVPFQRVGVVVVRASRLTVCQSRLLSKVGERVSRPWCTTTSLT